MVCFIFSIQCRCKIQLASRVRVRSLFGTLLYRDIHSIQRFKYDRQIVSWREEKKIKPPTNQTAKTLCYISFSPSFSLLRNILIILIICYQSCYKILIQIGTNYLFFRKKKKNNLKNKKERNFYFFIFLTVLYIFRICNK